MNGVATHWATGSAERTHQRWLAIFVGVVALHWVEHLAQAAQIWVFGWERPEAGGFIGYFFPTLVRTEALHFTYAVIMLVGLFFLRKGMHPAARRWWTVALAIQAWHLVEHAILQAQYLVDANLLGRPVPTSVAQILLPRVELHILYNLLVLVPMMMALSLHWFPPEEDEATGAGAEPVPTARLGGSVTA